MLGVCVGGDGLDDGPNEFLVAGVVHVVVVGEVTGFFFFGSRVVLRMHGNGVTRGAAEISLVVAFGVGEIELGRSGAYRAIHRWSIGKEWENCWGALLLSWGDECVVELGRSVISYIKR